MKTINLSCAQCATLFERPLKQHRANIKRGQKKSFCSLACSSRHSSAEETTATCNECDEEFKYRMVRRPRVFCSKSCSAKSKNKNRTITSNPKPCRECHTVVVFGKRKTCRDCKQKTQGISTRKIDYSQATLKDLRDKYNTGQYHAKLRGISRAEYKRNNGEMSCRVDGYSLHVDICHIKDVQDFPMSSTISEVNAFENLVALCKRCHWEFDNGYLSLD